MQTVDLNTLKSNKTRAGIDRALAIRWLFDTFGPSGDRWTMRNLTFVDFKKDRDATLFILHWS